MQIAWKIQNMSSKHENLKTLTWGVLNKNYFVRWILVLSSCFAVLLSAVPSKASFCKGFKGWMLALLFLFWYFFGCVVSSQGCEMGKERYLQGLSFSNFPSFSNFSIVCICGKNRNWIIFMPWNFSIFSIGCKFTGNYALKIIEIKEIL